MHASRQEGAVPPQVDDEPEEPRRPVEARPCRPAMPDLPERWGGFDHGFMMQAAKARPGRLVRRDPGPSSTPFGRWRHLRPRRAGPWRHEVERQAVHDGRRGDEAISRILVGEGHSPALDRDLARQRRVALGPRGLKRGVEPGGGAGGAWAASGAVRTSAAASTIEWRMDGVAMKRTFSFRFTRTVLTFSGALVLGAAGACGPRGEERAGPPAPAPVATAPSAPAGPTAPSPAVAGFDRLLGRWLRADGGYVLEVRAISPDGKADAAYLNPRPIHVARAEALRQGEALTLFVELRDANYPGSTYRLVYDPARDVLGGLYFQAVEQQTFDVEFVRR